MTNEELKHSWIRTLIISLICMFLTYIVMNGDMNSNERYLKEKVNYEIKDSTYKFKYDSLSKEIVKVQEKYDSLVKLKNVVELKYDTIRINRKVLVNEPIKSYTAHVDSFGHFINEFGKSLDK